MKTIKFLAQVSVLQALLMFANQGAARAEAGVPQSVIDRLGPTRPDCSTVEVEGFAVGGDPKNLSTLGMALEKSASFTDFQKFLTANPLMCSPSAMTQTYYCRGVASVEGKAVITSWGKDYYEIVQPLDFDGAPQLTMLYVNRSDAKCADKVKAAYGRYDNVLSARRSTDW